jgi:hypothetical protein
MHCANDLFFTAKVRYDIDRGTASARWRLDSPGFAGGFAEGGDRRARVVRDAQRAWPCVSITTVLRSNGFRDQ